jgi:hypothetical protein
VTLLELLISLAIIGLLLPVVAGWFTATTSAWQGTVERLEARQQALFIVRRVETEVREGRKYTVQKDGLFFLDNRGKWIRYSLSQNGLLLREEEGMGSTVIGAQIVSCQFAVLGEGRRLRMQLVTKAGRRQVSVEQIWTGRGSS